MSIRLSFLYLYPSTEQKRMPTGPENKLFMGDIIKWDSECNYEEGEETFKFSISTSEPDVYKILLANGILFPEGIGYPYSGRERRFDFEIIESTSSTGSQVFRGRGFKSILGLPKDFPPAGENHLTLDLEFWRRYEG